MLANLKIPFTKISWIAILLSVVMILASLYFVFTKGLNYGIDFKGGAKLEYKFSNHIIESEVRKSLDGLNLGDIQVIRFGQEDDNMMSVSVQLPEMHAKISPIITEALNKTFGNVNLESEETVGPKVGAEMRKKALLTILFSWLLMLIYIGYRFNFFFAPGAVVALVHDVIITLGILVFLGVEIDLVILAAILTIIGLSINDTIVIFDRIRENERDITPSTINEVVDKSLSATLSRTVITSLTVLFVALTLFYMGGGTLHGFALTMTIGIIVGTYSSLFIATPVYIGLYKAFPKYRKGRK